jgi:hypothetical protein
MIKEGRCVPLNGQCHEIFDSWFFHEFFMSLTPVANLPPVSTTLAKLVAKFAAGVIDTVGKFATGVDTSGAP